MKAQVAMEYIVTYGWALLAVMVLVAGLSFFGIFRPEDTLPEDCYLSTSIECKDYTLYIQDGSSSGTKDEFVEVYLVNLNREDLFVSRVQCILGAEHNMTVSDAFLVDDYDNTLGVGVMRTNRPVKIKCGGSAPTAEAMKSGAKKDVEIIIDVFTDTSFPHQVSGEVIAEVKKR